MFTAIKLQYLDTPSYSGGRASAISKEVAVDAVWDESVRLKDNDRWHDLGVDAKVTLLLEDETEVTVIDPKKVRIQLVETGDFYEILDAVAPVKDLGLERTYILMVKRKVDKA